MSSNNTVFQPHECFPLDSFDWVLRLCWTLLFLSGVFCNTTVMFCVLRHTTEDLKSYSYLLFFQATTENVVGIGFWIMTLRLVAHDPIHIIGSAGICGFIGSRFCFFIYGLSTAHVFTSVFIIPICFCSRFYMLYRNPPKKLTQFFICFLVSIPGIFYFIVCMTVLEQSAYLGKYEKCSELAYRGYFSINPNTALQRLMGRMIFLFIPAYIISIMAGFLIARTIKKMSSYYSSKWISLNKSILMSLISQACTPLIALIFVVFSQLYRTDVVDSNDTVSLAFVILGTIAPANGAVNLSFIPPYKKFVKSIFSKKTATKNIFVSSISVSSKTSQL